MALGELLALPVTVNVETAARALGISRNTAHDLIREDAFPVRTLKLGSATRVPTLALHEVLGVPVHRAEE
nr:helix-turn-helix domain-containing protein [Kitasatospora purpeofusca]